MRSKSSANFGSARGIVFSTSHSSAAVHVLGVAGAIVHTVCPLRSIRIVSPRYSTRLSRSENPRAAAVAERRCVRALGDPPEGRPTFRGDRGLAVLFFMESDYQRGALQPTLRAVGHSGLPEGLPGVHSIRSRRETAAPGALMEGWARAPFGLVP